ncbi:hypothetical protein BSL78_14466 [Apostichopus japonicus]|uniref:Uncharacterized protein n=1 Tax=Stichopus japonicus TaxID=307972 RepID=A0A2G8KKW9_STIJA|nr:hypothetical protein BSL78_14466 [Apostichopus japonicus]
MHVLGLLVIWMWEFYPSTYPKIWKEWLAETDKSPIFRTNASKSTAPDTPGSETTDIHKPVNHEEGAGPSAGSSEAKESNQAPPMWSFSDPTVKADCKCHRQKFLKSKQSVPFGKTPPGPGNSHMSSGLGSNSLGPSSKHKADNRTEKTVKNSKSTIPFHIRTSMMEDYCMYDNADISNERIPVSASVATPGTPGVSTSMNGVLQDMKGGSGT